MFFLLLLQIFGVDQVDTSKLTFEIYFYMYFFTTFVLTTIPAGVSAIILFITKNNVDNIMYKQDIKYTGSLNNFIDMIRIFKVYSNSQTLAKREKSLLLLTIILFIIGIVTMISWVVLMFCFPEVIFDVNNK